MRKEFSYPYLCLAAFGIFVLILATSNSYDWDHFFSFFEVELRSWLVDHEAPLWTYQLCAGVTRLGDPQSFGLSPLFLFVLLFGSFWGAKAIVFACTFIGFVFLKRILQIHDQSETHKRNTELLCLCFVFSNYYLWHSKVGHVTFFLQLFLFGPIYYFLLSLQRALTRKEIVISFLLIWTYCTAGFYHSLIFFLLPLSVSFFIYWIYEWYKTKQLNLKSSFLFAFIPGIILSSYKWVPILQYQAQFPRKVALTEEFNSIPQIFLNLFAPTWNDKFIGLFTGQSNWMIYENSAFSLLPILFLFLLWQQRSKKHLVFLLGWPIFLALPALILSMGDSAPISLHSMSNSLLYSQAVRVVGRYQILILFFFLLTAEKMLRDPELAIKFQRLTWPIRILIFMNFCTFLSPLKIDERNAVEIFQMKWLTPVKQHKFTESFMYPSVLRGGIVPNCYEPLNREMKIGHEFWRSPKLPAPQNGQIPLISADSPISDSCRNSAYVSQNGIFFDAKSCPPDLCFHLNMLNIYKKESLTWNPQRELFCRN